MRYDETMFLTHSDLHELTGKIQNAAQRRALARMGVPFKIRPDGSPAVYEKVLDIFKKIKVESQDIGPNWEAIT